MQLFVHIVTLIPLDFEINDYLSSFQISSRLSFDSGNRRSNRLAAEAGANTNASASMAAGNGTTNTSKIGSSKLGSVARSLTSRKGQPWANENLDEGIAMSHFSLNW